MNAGIEAEEARRAVASSDKEQADSDSKDEQNPSVTVVLDEHRKEQLRQLMSESSDLAKEVRIVLDVMAKRESQLVEEMERLKSALTDAVAALKLPPSKRVRRLRRDGSGGANGKPSSHIS